MQCEEARKQFTDYLNGTLADPVRPVFQQHLSECGSCRDEAEALESIWNRLGSIDQEEPDSAAMRARFDVMIEAYREGMDHTSRSRWWNNVNAWFVRWWPQQPALQFGLTLALLAAGVAAGHQYGKPAAAPVPQVAPAQLAELNQMRNELHDMRQMVALSLMQQQSASERLKGVSWSNQLDRPGTDVLNALMDTLMHDPNVNVRLAAVDALKKFGEHQIVRKGVLQALAKQDAPMVQVALIDYMVDTHEKESVDTLKKIAQNTSINETVRQRAEWGLEQLQ